jgi:hypothetical protein
VCMGVHGVCACMCVCMCVYVCVCVCMCVCVSSALLSMSHHLCPVKLTIVHFFSFSFPLLFSCPSLFSTPLFPFLSLLYSVPSLLYSSSLLVHFHFVFFMESFVCSPIRHARTCRYRAYSILISRLRNRCYIHPHLPLR